MGWGRRKVPREHGRGEWRICGSRLAPTLATLSATADDIDILTAETEIACAPPPFASPAAQGPSLDRAEKAIMEERTSEGTHIC